LFQLDGILFGICCYLRQQFVNWASVVGRRNSISPPSQSPKTLYGILMTQLSDTYKIVRTCTSCGHGEKLIVTKRETAFELFDFDNTLGKECKNCSSTTFTTSYQRPDLDFDLLKEWATNSDLYLMPQDEELLLAEEQYLDMILQVLDTISTPDHKRDLLMDALCVIVYDNTSNDNSERNEELKMRVIEELNKRQDKLKLADNWIMDYIKDFVYPQLDFGRQNAV
jgi:hypothetical protein